MSTVNGYCDRRSFLRGTLAICGAAFFPEFLALGSSQLHVFLQEVPSVFTEGIGSGLGMLLVRYPEAVEAQINHLRVQFHFRTRLRHSTNKFQRDFVNNLLDYFFKEPDVRFAARVLTKRTAQKETEKDFYELYKFHYKQFLRDNLPTNQGVVITLPDNRRSAAYRVLQDLKSEFPVVDQINRAAAVHKAALVHKSSVKHKAGVNQNDLLEMSGYIARYVCGEAPSATVLSNRTKVEILHHLRGRLNVTTLLDPSLSHERKFKVQTV
jgi:hypothetical protein